MKNDFETGVYQKIIENTLFEYSILKVMKKTLHLELRTYNYTTNTHGEVWFNRRFPKYRIDLKGYKKVK